MTEINKTTKTQKVENLLFSLQLICVVINVFCAVWRINEAMSILLVVSSIITGLLTFVTIANKQNKYTVVIWMFICLLSFFSVSRGKPDFTFQYIKNWIVCMSTINLYFWVYAAEVNYEMIKKILISGVVTAGIFIVAFLTNRTKSNPDLPGLVTFGLGNPNTAGIYLLNIFLCIFIMTKFVKETFFKLFLYVLCGVLFYFIYLTMARSCIIAATACILLSFCTNKKYSKFLTFLIIIFPLIFVFLYLKFIDTGVANLFEFMVTIGKPLTSRVKIWEYTIAIIKNNILLGNYSLGVGNKHNTHLMLLATFGVPTFSLIIIFLNRIVNYIGQFIKSKYQFTALYSFYAIIIMGTFEAVLFSGSQEMYVFSGAFLLIAKYVAEKDLIKDKTTE